MALHSGVDTVAFISHGVYSSTYSGIGDQNIANAYASLGVWEGYLWDTGAVQHLFGWFWEYF